MNRKLKRMMRANPRLRMTSGRRDESLQRQLKRKGFGDVSGKSSAHTRGLAADLGPQSQYPWIVANAKKFGLKSGAGVGEPWHVGIGDTSTTTGGDEGDTTATTAEDVEDAASAIGGFGALLNLFLSGGGEDPLGTVGNALPGFLNMLFGGLSQGVQGKTDEKLKQGVQLDPDFEKKFTDAMKWQSGGKFGFETDKSKRIWTTVEEMLIAARGAMRLAEVAAEVAGASNVASTKTLADAVRAIGQDPGSLSAGALVAKIAAHAGFSGDNLVSAVAISERESSFNPAAHRSDRPKEQMSGDRGLWQINAGAWNDWMIQQGFIKDPLDQAIFDPNVNARVARGIYLRSNNFSAWSMAAGGWSAGGDPFYGTNRSTAAGFVAEAGLGDVESVIPMEHTTAPSSATPATSSGTIQFNNTFQITGGNGANGGIDVRRTVTQIADQLEAEMRRRLARYN